MTRFLTALFALIILTAKIFAPITMIVLFAVSPMDALTGVKAEKVTVEGAYICPMGIEWKPNSQEILEKYGMSHANHGDHGAHHHHGEHHAHHAAADDADTESQGSVPNSEDCLISLSLTLALTLPLLFAFAYAAVHVFAGFYVFVLTFREKRRTLRDFFTFLPPKQAPPYAFS